jgi:hypothetical protein
MPADRLPSSSRNEGSAGERHGHAPGKAANGYTRSEGVSALLKRGLEAVRIDAVVAANRAAKLKKR